VKWAAVQRELLALEEWHRRKADHSTPVQPEGADSQSQDDHLPQDPRERLEAFPWNETNLSRNNNAKNAFNTIQKLHKILSISTQLKELIVPKTLEIDDPGLIQQLVENFDVIKAHNNLEHFGELVQLLNCKKPLLQRTTVELINVILEYDVE